MVNLKVFKQALSLDILVPFLGELNEQIIVVENEEEPTYYRLNVACDLK